MVDFLFLVALTVGCVFYGHSKGERVSDEKHNQALEALEEHYNARLAILIQRGKIEGCEGVDDFRRHH